MNLTFREMVDEAFALVGGEQSTGFDYRSAGRSVKLLMADWHTRGIHNWQVATTTFSTVASTATYTMATDVVRILEMNRVESGNDEIVLTPMSRQEYANLTVKNTSSGKPTRYWEDRQNAATQVTLWSVPNAVQTISVFYLQQMTPPGKNATSLDIPFYYQRAMVFGLSVDMAMKRGLPEQRIAMLKGEYEGCLTRAMQENRSRSSFNIRLGRR
ncbi:MAG: hypothetical protein NXI16_01255 [Alphaproteobacteria bacterium]|nr:hypothetical protein [Alphaproteobacteria bacterium]